MADLSYTVDVKGHEDLPKLAAGITAVATALGNGKDIATKLAEFKAAMGGMGGSLDGLNKFEEKLEHIKQTIGGLSDTLQREMKEMRQVAATGAADISAELAKMSATPSQATFKQSIPKAQDIGQVKQLSTAFQKLTIDGNDVHSAMRGLASGFNLLWLTWGNLLPLFAGAAISNGFMKTAKEGLAVTQTLGTIAYIGENTKEEMKSLTGELVRMGNEGIYGPMAIAEAMQTLSLAGLKANEILAVTGTVMGFSVAGATDIKAAADVLVSVTTAFGTGAGGFARSADIIMRAAADSKASVESFGQAMKTASVVGEQYGAKQEEVALLIQYMANLGIQGTAAGTAVRNMYADISGRSGPARKAMQALGLEFRDANGHVVGLKEQTTQLLTVLSKYDGKSQANIIQAIYGERGAKAAIEMLAKAKTFVEVNGKLVSQLDLDLEKLQNSYGDAAIAAAKMETTTSNAFKAAAATLETTLFQAFTAMEPQLYSVAVALRSAFSSPETLESLKTLVSFIADIAKYIAEHLDIIVKLAAGYAIFRAAVALTNGILGSSIGILSRYAAAKMAAAAATIEAGTAEGIAAAQTLAAARATELANRAAAGRTVQAAAGLTTILGGAARVVGALSGIGTAVAIGAGLWSIYNMWSTRSGSTMEDLAGKKNDDIVDALNKEASHLETVNGLRREGLTLAQAEAEAKIIAARADNTLGGITTESQLQADITKAEKSKQATLELINALKTAGSTVPAWATKKVLEDDQTIGKADLAINQIRSKVQTDAARIDAVGQRMRRDRKEADQIAAEERERERKASEASAKLVFGNPGNLAWEQTQGGANKHTQKPRSYDEQTLPNLQKQMDSELSVIKARFDSEKSIQDSEYKNLLVTKGQYQAKVLASTVTYEQESLASIESHAKDYVNAYVEQYAEIKKVRDGFKPDSENWKAEDAKLEALRNKATADMQADEDKHVKIKLDSVQRQILAANELAGETRKLIKADEEYWTKSKLETDKIESMQKVAEQYRNINTSVFSNATALKAEAEAIAESKAQHEGQLENIRKEIELRVDAIAALEELLKLEKAKANITGNSAVSDEFERAVGANKAQLEGLRDRYSKSVAEGTADGARRGALAYQKEMEAKAAELTNVLADSIETALTEGGAAGAKKLKAYLLKALIIDPIMVQIKAVIQPMVGQMISGGSGASGGGMSGGGGGMGGMGGGGMFSSAYDSFARSGVGQSLGLSNSGAYVGNNPSAYSPVGGTNLTSAGQMGANAIQVMGNTLAGYAMGSMFQSMISGGYSVSKGMETFQKIGIAVGSAIGGPVVGALIGAAAGVFNRLFGRKLADSGIQGEFGGARGFEGESFEYYKGGLFRSDKTKTNPLAEEVRKVLGDAFNTMRIQVGIFATSLGLNTDKIKNFTTKIKVSTKGLSDADAEKAIQQALATANNELAEQVIGTWTDVTETVKRQVASTAMEMEAGADAYRVVEETITQSTYQASEFAREGEKAIDTLTRLATSLTLANTWFKRLGATLFDASLGGADRASKFVDAAGGAEAFDAQASSYYNNYYTSNQRRQAARGEIQDRLGAAGLDMPQTASEFRNMMDAAIAAGEAGQDAAVALFGVSGAFAELYGSIGQLEEAMGVSATSLKAILDDVRKGAITSAEAGQRFEDSIYDGLGSAMTQGLSQMIMNAVVGPLIDGLLLGATGSSAAMAAGGVAGGTAAATGGAAAGGAVAAGGAAAGSAMAQGGAIAGAAVASTIEQAQAYMAGFAAIMNDPAIRDMIRDIAQGFGEIAGGMPGMTGGLSGVSTAMVNTGSAASSMGDSVSALGDSIEAEVKRLRGLMVDASPMKGRDALLAEFTTATAQARAGDQSALEKLPGLSQSLEEATRLSAGSSVELARMRGWLAGSLVETQSKFAAQTDAQWRAARANMTSPGYDIRDTPTYSSSYDARPVYRPWEEATADSRYANSWDTTPIPGTGNLRGQDPNAMPDIRYTGGGIGAAQYDARDPRYVEDWRYRDSWSATPTLRNPRPSWYGPAYAQGTPYVPEDGLAMLHKGEMVIPAAYNPAGRSASAGGQNDEVVQELRALRAEVVELRTQQKGETLDQQRINLRTAKILERWEQGGMPTPRQDGVIA